MLIKNDGYINVNKPIHARHIIEYVNVRKHMSNVIANNCFHFCDLTVTAGFILQLMLNIIYDTKDIRYRYDDMDKNIIKMAVKKTGYHYKDNFTFDFVEAELMDANILDDSGRLTFNPLFIGNKAHMLLDLNNTKHIYITYVRVNTGNDHKIINFSRAKAKMNA